MAWRLIVLQEIRNNNYPICDADIWVYVCFGRIEERLFEVHNKIVIADVVENEILRWKHNPKFSFVAKQYIEYKDQDKILVINHDIHIPEEDRVILESMLIEFGFQNYFENKPPEKDKGEYVSAIYADYFGIKLFRTNDNLFAEGGRGRKDFPELHVQNWSETLRILVPNYKAFIEINKKIEEEQKRCQHHREKNKVSTDIKGKEQKLDLIAALQNKWS